MWTPTPAHPDQGGGFRPGLPVGLLISFPGGVDNDRTSGCLPRGHAAGQMGNPAEARSSEPSGGLFRHVTRATIQQELIVAVYG